MIPFLKEKMKINIIAIVAFFPVLALAVNTENTSFSTSKKLLEKSVYADHRRTLYCDAEFSADNTVTLPDGFTTEKHARRASRIEWEHVVPAENFGRTFQAWREGDPACIDSKGKAFKGRKCASKVSKEYQLMQADMYNLYPAIGVVNAARSNYNFTLLGQDKSNNFGSCAMKIADRKVEPPEAARGRIARTYLYMEATYPRYHMSKAQRQLMLAWDKQYPVSDWECIRYQRIKMLQHSENKILKAACG